MDTRALIVIGPSGVGKSTIFSALRRDGVIDIIPTWTTRAPRHYEHASNTDHVFCSEAEFRRRVSEDYFMETAQPFGLDAYYGLPHLSEPRRSGSIPVLMLRAGVMGLVEAQLSDYIVYQVEAPYERVRDHLQLRESRDGKLGNRLDNYAQELMSGRRFANRIVDNSRPLADTLNVVKGYLQEDFATHPVLRSAPQKNFSSGGHIGLTRAPLV
jgi:guanylate kinase